MKNGKFTKILAAAGLGITGASVLAGCSLSNTLCLKSPGGTLRRSLLVNHRCRNDRNSGRLGYGPGNRPCKTGHHG